MNWKPILWQRHVQHHAAQLNLILRQTVDSPPRGSLG